MADISSPDTSASRLPPSDEVVALLGEINKSLKVQNERLARLEARRNIRQLGNGREHAFQEDNDDVPNQNPVTEDEAGASTSQAFEQNNGNYNREDMIVLLEKDLRDAGKTSEEIYRILGNMRRLPEQAERQNPTWTRISRKFISPETLDHYKIAWTFDSDPSFILINRWVPQAEQTLLFDHTKTLRSKRRPSFTTPYDEEPTETLDDPDTVKILYLSEVIPSITGEPLSRGFLQAPWDHRIMTGFLGDRALPTPCTVEFQRLRKAWLSRQEDLVWPQGTRPDLWSELMNFMRMVDESNANFFIRDFDRHSNNRLYSLGEIAEYGNREDPFASPGDEPWIIEGDVKRLPGADGLQVSPVTWHTKDDQLLFRPLPQPHFAPWMRTILLEGLASLFPQMTDPPFINLPFITGENRAIYQHLKGGSAADYVKPPSVAAVHLQFSWFKITKFDQTQNPLHHEDSQGWSSGKLYGSTNKLLQEQVWTCKSVYRSAADPRPAESHLGNELYWTSLLLTPVGFYTKGTLANDPINIFNEHVNELPVFLLYRCIEVVEKLVSDWDHVLNYAISISLEKNTTFDPEVHDSIFSSPSSYDDDAFARSRTLWWVIDATAMFEKSLADAEAVYTSFLETIVGPMREEYINGQVDSAAHEMVYIAERKLQNFARLREKNDNIRTRATALRVAILSANALVESRATVRLERSVRRLTWAVGLLAPVGVGASLVLLTPEWRPWGGYFLIPICLSTYLGGFKLDEVVRWGKRVYGRFVGGGRLLSRDSKPGVGATPKSQDKPKPDAQEEDESNTEKPQPSKYNFNRRRTGGGDWLAELRRQRKRHAGADEDEKDVAPTPSRDPRYLGKGKGKEVDREESG